MITGTIYELLTTANPDLNTRDQPTGNVTQNKLYVYLRPADISIWEDFTFENIEAAYAHLFPIGPIQSDALHPFPRGSPAYITTEASVDNISQLWSSLICRFPLKRGCERLQADLGLNRVEISMGAKKLYSYPPQGGKAFEPDWGIYLNTTPKTALVWGDNKCSSKWKSDPNVSRLASNRVWAFRQIATYCYNENTRYSYIVTPDELAAIRVVKDPTASGNHRVQYKSIPWSHHGPNVLTMNLAIWALAMMAVNEEHRPILPIHQNLPLNLWWQDMNHQTGEGFFQHHLSGRILQTLPVGAISRPRPEPTP